MSPTIFAPSARNATGRASGARRRAAAGFTLIEVAIGAFIIGVIVISFYTLVAQGFNMVRMNRENLRASQILINRMEGLRLYTWSQLVSNNMVPATFTEYYYPFGSSNAVGTVYSGRMNVTAADMNPPATYSTNRMCRVVVSLNWSTGGIQRSRTMSTLVARYGAQNYIFGN